MKRMLSYIISSYKGEGKATSKVQPIRKILTIRKNILLGFFKNILSGVKAIILKFHLENG